MPKAIPKEKSRGLARKLTDEKSFLMIRGHNTRVRLHGSATGSWGPHQMDEKGRWVAPVAQCEV
jgi:hypothetical protein